MQTQNDVLKILTVDDDPDFLEFLFRSLRRYGEVTRTVDSQEALRLMESGQFDLLVLDYKMPDMDGLELLRQLEAKRIVIPSILVSGYPDAYLAEEAADLGTIYFIWKTENSKVNRLRLDKIMNKYLLERGIDQVKLEILTDTAREEGRREMLKRISRKLSVMALEQVKLSEEN